MKTDSDIRRDVEAELRWDPRVPNASAIGVSVKNGITTLSGHAASYAEKWEAERAAERVGGVTALASELDVHLLSEFERTDEEVAQAVVNALKWDILIPSQRIKAKVTNGWVTLEGDVDWQFQRDAAMRAVRHLFGVKGVSDAIALKSPVSQVAVKSDIEAALKRNASVDAQGIGVKVDGHNVTLTGKVRSSAERKQAEQAAWAAPGVYHVDNLIAVAA